jgi:hypothetical protein
MTTIDVTADDRDQAIRAVRRKRGFRAELGSYLLVNAILWFIWFATGGAAEQGYWPAWVSAAWGIGLAFSAYHTYGQRPVSEAAIDAELQKMHRP